MKHKIVIIDSDFLELDQVILSKILNAGSVDIAYKCDRLVATKKIERHNPFFVKAIEELSEGDEYYSQETDISFTIFYLDSNKYCIVRPKWGKWDWVVTDHDLVEIF